jgi:hypothetical protein
MNDLEQMMNELSDSELEWWPFAFLRPKPEQRMTTARVLALASLYGVMVGMFANAMVALMGLKGEVHVLTFPACATALYFAVYRFSFAYFWNRRAERIARIRSGSARVAADASNDASIEGS